ncbi:MAG: hypothetical protein E3J35_08925 [Methanomassiliicoccales archaeon]|nr:MAG: hypothetical protein E3J35_08925 [Methanomassiliicoccales archaeon]
MKKTILVALVLLTSFFATVAILPETARATTYFVGGAGPGNYTTIQAALNTAGLGDTVYVYSGIYRENVFITNVVSLVGESKDSTIIDAQNVQRAITISSDSVKVSGFTVTNGGPGISLMSVNNCEIYSNVISNNGGGITISDSVGNIIRDNIISSNSQNGIELSKSGSAFIANNVVSSNGRYGIYVSSSVGNTIMNNHVSSNEYGVFLYKSSSNDIIGNTAWSNDYTRDPYGAGIWLKSSSSNQIEGNNASSNYRDGIRLEGSASNVITGNVMSSNYYGIYLESSSDNVISDNRVSLNGNDGIYFDSSSSNTISLNSISSNDDGIRLSSSGNNTIFRNSVSSNSYYGLSLSLSDSNRIYHNNIVGNKKQAYDDGANQWDDGYPSGGNYWSDYVGIDQFSGLNQDLPGSDGIGDSLYYIYPGTSVDYYPKVDPNVVPKSPPSQPQNLDATPGDSLVTLTWNAPTYDGGSPVLNYRIYRRESGASEEFLIQIGNVLTYTDTGLANGEEYRYKVSARNQVGEGLKSEEVRTTPATVPGPPLGLAAVAESRLVTLTWMPPSDSGGSPVTNFRIYRGMTPGGESLLAEVGNVQQFLDIGLTNGVTYYYRISAKNEVGEGAMSEEVAATPAAILTVPSPPTRFSSSAGDHQITLTWAAPADNGGSPITNYAIYRGSFSGGEAFLVEIGNTLSFIDTNVTNGQIYSYRVSARNAIGEGQKSDSVSAVPMTVPGPPIGLAVTEGDGRLTLTWLPPIDNGGSPVTHYSVYRGLSPGGEAYLTTPGNVLTYVNGGLTNGVTYYYKVTASNAMGEGESSSEVSATPLAPQPNQAPSCAFSSPSPDETISDRSVMLGIASDPDGTVEFVEVRVDSSGWARAIGTTSWSYELDTTLLSDGRHTIYARSFDGTDYSALATLTVTIKNAGETTPDKHAFDWTLFGTLIVIFIALMAILGVLLYRRIGGKETKSVENEIEAGKERT